MPANQNLPFYYLEATYSLYHLTKFGLLNGFCYICHLSMALIEKFSALGTRSAPDFVANFCINSFSHLFTALYATAGGSIVSSGAPGRPYLKKCHTHKKLGPPINS